MKQLLVALLIGLGAGAGCFDPNEPISYAANKLTQIEADAITKKCNAPRSMLTVKNGILKMRPGRDMQVAGCVLDEIEATGKTSFKSVGNEMYRTPGRP